MTLSSQKQLMYLQSNQYLNRHSKIAKIVLTGGPCGGKTDVLPELTKTLEEQGYKVFVVPETATEIMTAGALPQTFDSISTFQYFIYLKQLQEEKLYEDIAFTYTQLNPEQKVVIICDRGKADGSAYMSSKDFEDILARFGHTKKDVYNSYDAVFHLQSTAVDAKEFYQWNGGEGDCNNPVRREKPEEASVLDSKTAAAWKEHPHLRIIDNSTDFQHKVQRLINEVIDFIEQKFS